MNACQYTDCTIHCKPLSLREVPVKIIFPGYCGTFGHLGNGSVAYNHLQHNCYESQLVPTSYKFLPTIYGGKGVPGAVISIGPEKV